MSLCRSFVPTVAAGAWLLAAGAALADTHDTRVAYAQQLGIGNAATIRVLVRPTTAVFSTKVTPEALPKVATLQCVKSFGDRDLDDLVDVLKSMRYLKANIADDIYWQVIFQNEDGDTIKSIYFGTGRDGQPDVQGVFGGRAVLVGKPILDWLQQVVDTAQCKQK